MIFKKIMLCISDFFSIFGISIFLLMLLVFYFEYSQIGLISTNPGVPTIGFSNQELKLIYNANEQNVEDYKQVIIESWYRKIGSKVQKYEPLVEYVEAEYHGKFVKISEYGYRHIGDQANWFNPEDFNVFIYGGSTTFGYGVKDSETIPSYLQVYLKEHIKDRKIAVYNFGVGYYYSTLERIRFLKHLTSGYKPDVAVFIDGLKDFDFSVFPDHSGKSREIGEITSTYEDKSALWKNAINRLNILSWLKTKILFLKENNDTVNESDLLKADPKILSKKLVNRLNINRYTVNEISKKLGIMAFFVNQPVRYYKYNPTNSQYSFNYSGDPKIIQIVKELTSEGYKQIEEGYALGKYNDMNLILIHELNIKENQYIDFVHYSPAYSKAIAKEIFEKMKNEIKLKK